MTVNTPYVQRCLDVYLPDQALIGMTPWRPAPECTTFPSLWVALVFRMYDDHPDQMGCHRRGHGQRS